jgi:hypothetical protein
LILVTIPPDNPSQGAYERVENPLEQRWFMARDNLIRLVQLSFWAVVVFSVVLIAGAQTGGLGVPSVLGALLFLIIMSSALVSRRSAVSGDQGFMQAVVAQKKALLASILDNKVGALVIIAILIGFVFLATSAIR